MTKKVSQRVHMGESRRGEGLFGASTYSMEYNVAVAKLMRLPTTNLLKSLAPWVAAAALVLLVLLVYLFTFTTAVSAAGEKIQVLSDEREVRFPGDVVFNLELEAKSDIVEVRLYFRAAPSGIWTYTYPTFTPSSHVKVSFDLDVTGVGYQPPGTELEYYYSIRDSEGNTVETGRETFFNVDNRFQWKTVTAGPLTISWHDLPEERVREVAQGVEQQLDKISEILQVDLDKPMKGIIYNTRSEASEAFPRQSQTITEKQVFQGFAFPDRGVFVGVGLHLGLIVHESAHLLLDNATDAPGARLPAWVNEGFASFVEPGVHSYARGFPRGATPDLMPLSHMDSVPGRPGDIRYFYRKAESVVGYLLENHGPEDFRTFLAEISERHDVDRALITAYGFGLDVLDRKWSTALSQQEGDEDRNTTAPFAGMTTALIGIVVLVVMGVVIVNLVLRRLSRRVEGSEEWDGLSQDEWEGRP